MPHLDFCSSAGFLTGSGARARSGAPGKGPQVVITDLGMMKPAADTEELELVAVFEGVTAEQVRQATGWDLRVADRLEQVIERDPRRQRCLRVGVAGDEEIVSIGDG